LSSPSVGIVVLNWNGRAYLSDCLASLSRQSYTGPREIVLVDNGSDDGSAAFVQGAFPEVKVIRSPTNVGFSAGNNLGARQLETDLLAFVNNDTRADERWLEELVAAVSQAPDVASAGGRILSWDGMRVDFAGGGATLTGFGLQFGFGQPATEAEPERDMLFACGGSMIVKRQLYWEVGGLDDDYFLFYEDVDLGWRFWLAGYRVRYAPRSVVYHRHHGSTHRIEDHRLAVLYERNALYTIYKNYDDGHLAMVLPAALLLAAERATVLAGIDRATFSISAAPSPPVAGSDPSPPTAGNWAKLRESVRRFGVLATARRVGSAARSRARPRVSRLRMAFARRVGGHRQAVTIPAAAASRLFALEQFGANLPALRAKREIIQRFRRRSDDEIIELFKTPLDPGFAGRGFSDYHYRVLAALRLDQWVEEATSRPRPVSHA
jgi:GT2 family glycosyltransferase